MDAFFEYETERNNSIKLVNTMLQRRTGVPNIINDEYRTSLEKITNQFCYECYDRETYVLVKIKHEVIPHLFPTCISVFSSEESDSSEASDKGDEINESEGSEEIHESEEIDEELYNSYSVDIPDNYAKVLAIYGHFFCDCGWRFPSDAPQNHQLCLQNALDEINKNKTKCAIKTMHCRSKHYDYRSKKCEKINHSYYSLCFDISGNLFLNEFDCYDCIFEHELKNDHNYDDYTKGFIV